VLRPFQGKYMLLVSSSSSSCIRHRQFGLSHECSVTAPPFIFCIFGRHLATDTAVTFRSPCIWREERHGQLCIRTVLRQKNVTQAVTEWQYRVTKDYCLFVCSDSSRVLRVATTFTVPNASEFPVVGNGDRRCW
jgi:hypothetical protein